MQPAQMHRLREAKAAARQQNQADCAKIADLRAQRWPILAGDSAQRSARREGVSQAA